MPLVSCHCFQVWSKLSHIAIYEKKKLQDEQVTAQGDMGPNRVSHPMYSKTFRSLQQSSKSGDSCPW